VEVPTVPKVPRVSKVTGVPVVEEVPKVPGVLKVPGVANVLSSRCRYLIIIISQTYGYQIIDKSL
jgi:hypothetical protein